MSTVSNEDDNVDDQNRVSLQAVDRTESPQPVDRTESLQPVDNTDLDQRSISPPIASRSAPPFHIGHLPTCASKTLIVDRLLAKLFPRPPANPWLSLSDSTYPLGYRNVSAPRRMKCPACRVIADATRFFWPDRKVKARSYGWSHLGYLFNTQYPVDDEHLELFTMLGDRSLFLSIDRDPFPTSKSKSVPLDIRNPLYGNFSEQAISWANECIDRCDQQHPMCSSSSQTARLPTRVLDLEVGLSHNVVRLVDMKGQSGRYICLSHCWGKSRNKCLTTKASLEANKASIPVDQLPPSMRDAIVVTRKFGVRYLWIDSLCIVQDSDEDWSHEAAQMASIYENAFLTIGATSSESDEEAFLQPPRTLLKLQVKTLEGTLQDLYVQSVESRPDRFPLLGRAWCYQERLLSPRTLHFTSRELLWECRTSFTCECGNTWYHSGIKEEKASIYSDMAQPQLWRLIVRNYSGLNLTLEKDKLPALSGLAQKAQELRKDKYLAGLWSRTSVDDLCWFVTSPKSQLQEWRAPSWSWASVNSQVLWHEKWLSPQEVPLSERTYAADVDVIACETVPLQEDQLGGVSSGFFTLRGKLSPAVLGPNEYEDEPPRNKPKSRLNRISKRLSRANSPNEKHREHQHFTLQSPSSSIFSATYTYFRFYPDHCFDSDLQSLTGRLFKLRMYHNIEDTEETRGLYEASQCYLGYMILRSGADGSSSHERIGWADFHVNLSDDTAFPKLLEDETEEVITII